MGSQGKFQPSPSTFVGRESELAELRAGLDEAVAGHGRLFLISGEPGIGKTRITNELAAYASAAGAKVTRGQCWEGRGTPAYWPWIEIVRTCVGDPASARLSALLDSDRGEISELLPEVAQRRRSSPVVQLRGLPSPDPDEGRFRLFDSAAHLLKDVAATQPLVILLDDLHDADQPSLLMLRFVARELGGTRILIAATYRDTEVRRSPALAKLIGELGRESKQLPLAGLSAAEVARFVAEHSRESPTPELILMLHRATAGNPFFLDGIVRLLEARPGPDPDGWRTLRNLRIPDGVREAIRLRLATFPEETNNILSVAAVVGQEFDADCLQRVSEEDADSLLDALDEAQRDGIIIAANDTSALWRFSHGLIREALYEDLPTRRRLKLHRRIAQVLEESYAGNPEPHLAELAYHYRKAARLGETAKAFDYSIRAGEAALTVFAVEETVLQWQAALGLAERQEHAEKRQADLCLRLGLVMKNTDWVKSLEYTEKALKLCEVVHRPKLAAYAHLLAGKTLSDHGPQMDVRRSLEHYRKAQVLVAEFEGDSAAIFSGYLDSGLSAAAQSAMLTREGLAAARRAMETAQRLGDDALFVESATTFGFHLFQAGQLTDAFTLFERAWEKGDRLKAPLPAHGAAVTGGICHMWLREGREARIWFERELSKSRTNTPFWRGMFANWLGQTLMQMGEVNEALPLLAQTPVEFPDVWKPDGLIHLWEGRWEQAEKWLTRARDQFRQAGGRAEYQLLSVVRRILGKYASAVEFLLDALAPCEDELLQFLEMWARPELALIYAETGRAQEALPHLCRCREIMSAGEDWHGMVAGILMAEAVVGAALCHPGLTDVPEAISASVPATQERFRQAQAQFEQAVGIFRHYQAPLDEAETLYQWARALIRTGRHADGAEKLDAAVELYRHCGAGAPWIERALAAKSERPAAIMTDLPEQVEAEAIFRREADYWTICFSGAVCRLRDAKGLHYIANLLRHPGVEFKAIDLAQMAGPKGAGRVDVTPLTTDEGGMQTRRDLGDAGPLLDAKAKSDYRRRLHELGEELEESGRLNDLGREERLREEIELVTAELTVAIGRGGRDRKVASHLERARWMVSKRIKFSVSQIQHANPALGSHLTQNVRTGNYCAYLPKQPVDWHF